MKKIIFNNIGLKILALLIAVIVWWVVMNIDDPLVKKDHKRCQCRVKE